jgi:hypothetical protein
MPKWGGDGTSMLSTVPDSLVNIAHSQKSFEYGVVVTCATQFDDA